MNQKINPYSIPFEAALHHFLYGGVVGALFGIGIGVILGMFIFKC